MPEAPTRQRLATGHNADMNRLVKILFATALFSLLAACGGSEIKKNPLDKVLASYAAAIRWSEFDRAIEFVDPKVRQEQPLTDLERERFKLIQVTAYEVKRMRVLPDSTVEQVVEIRLVGKNTQIERMITDHQSWRWDPEAKVFWLTTGLPDFTPK